MTGDTRLVDQQTRRLRGERILESARELLVKWGYRRVTIEEVAEGAGIGKGTVYLHWKSREEMYYAIILRDYLKALEGLVDDMRQDERETLPHRIVRAKYLSAASDPVLRALFASEGDLIDALVKGGLGEQLARLDMISSEYLQILIDHRVVRRELTHYDLAYGIGTITRGFLSADSVISSRGSAEMDLTRRAQLLEAAIKRTFEIDPTPRALSALAPQVVKLLGDSIKAGRGYLEAAYEGTRHGGRGGATRQ